MPICNRTLGLQRPVKYVAPNVVHGRLLILAREEVVERVVRAVGPIVEPVPDRLGLRHARYIRWQPLKFWRRAQASRPPCSRNKF